MKKIKVPVLFLAYIFLLLALPISPLTKAVQANAAEASDTSIDCSKDYKNIKLERNVDVKFATICNDYDLLLDNNKLIFLKNGEKIKNVALNNKNRSKLIGSSGNKIYALDYSMTTTSIVKSINVANGKVTSTNKIPAKIFRSPSISAVDKKGTIWFTTGRPNDKYYLLAVNPKNGKTTSAKFDVNKKQRVSAPVVDINNNIYFAVSGYVYKATYENSKVSLKKYQVSDLKSTEYWEFDKFVVDKDGNLWTQDSEHNAVEYKLDGNTYKKAATVKYDRKGWYVKLAADANGDIWLMNYQSQSRSKGTYGTADIYKLENGSLVKKYSIGGIGYTRVSFEASNDNRLLVCSMTWLENEKGKDENYIVYTSINRAK